MGHQKAACSKVEILIGGRSICDSKLLRIVALALAYDYPYPDELLDLPISTPELASSESTRGFLVQVDDASYDDAVRNYGTLIAKMLLLANKIGYPHTAAILSLTDPRGIQSGDLECTRTT